MHDAGEAEAGCEDEGSGEEEEEEESVRVETLSVRWRVIKTRSDWRLSLPERVLMGLLRVTLLMVYIFKKKT